MFFLPHIVLRTKSGPVLRCGVFESEAGAGRGGFDCGGERPWVAVGGYGGEAVGLLVGSRDFGGGASLWGGRCWRSFGGWVRQDGWVLRSLVVVLVQVVSFVGCMMLKRWDMLRGFGVRGY